MRRKLFLLLFSCHISLAVAQVDSIVQDIFLENIENQVSDVENDVIDNAEILENLQQYEIQKINLNNLDADIAYLILNMTDYQYYQLQLYIEKYGELVTIYELAAVDGFTQEDVERMKNRVEVLPSKKSGRLFANFFRRSRQTLLLRYGQVLEKQAGYDLGKANGYLGSPLKLTLKYTFQSGEHFSMALAAEKDAGEQFFKGTQKQGFDHYAFFLNLKNIGVLKNLVIGDYRLNFGQGLIFGSSLMGSKGGGAAQVRQIPTALFATAPMNESNALRGVACVLGNSSYSATIFYAHRFFDGEIKFDADSNEFYQGSLSNAGNHRTELEMAQKNRLRNRIYGAHFSMQRRIFSLGATIAETDFISQVLPAEDLYKLYDFSGKHVLNASLDYKCIVHKSILFGEFAMSSNKGFALLQGMFYDVDPRCKLSLLFRYYDKKYIALQSGAFGENKLSHNEMGLYFVTDFVTGRNTSLVFNADCYYFPWLRFRVDAPSCGFDCSVKFQFTISRNVSGYVRYQYRRKTRNLKIVDYYNSINQRDKHQFRVVLTANAQPWLRLKSEADFVLNSAENHEVKKGFILAQDVDFLVERWQLEAKMRMAIFNTDSYDERLSVYEQDLLYTFTINNHYGRGVRYYLILNYHYRFMNFQIKFSQTYWDDKFNNGSGNTLIQRNTKSELKAQIIFHV